ncbi:hypothetical protein M902_0743 [Bacteriovorax sp. BAL6_X]|uniref:hypothetical protein n=1 Tax=Bacteriovorax sp. BAL6_X TaxID=1201290 RepID=UPI0003867436|nr:hypothetical protein [Bacteriovorax sp. BAL6_X]EPZ49936.1 hypothetical protein M902_0743 [Bacteriovorax sp. BAL6_X]
MNTKNILIVFGAFIFIIVAGAIGYGQYKEYVDSKLLSKEIFIDKDGNGLADYSEAPLKELLSVSQRMEIGDDAKKIIRTGLNKVIPAIEDLYTSDELETNAESVKTMRCFYRELSYYHKEYQLDMYQLMPLVKYWDQIQYPNGASKSFLQKKIGRIGVKSKINNKYCFNNGFATTVRPEPKGFGFGILKKGAGAVGGALMIFGGDK